MTNQNSGIESYLLLSPPAVTLWSEGKFQNSILLPASCQGVRIRISEVSQPYTSIVKFFSYWSEETAGFDAVLSGKH